VKIFERRNCLWLAAIYATIVIAHAQAPAPAAAKSGAARPA